jgi:4-hydroxy-tetrahydrodipicolinate synthase
MRACRGSIVALVTPMYETEDIDFDSIDALLEWHISSGTAGVVAVGTTGESATLSMKEHCKVITHMVDKAHGRIPIIAGTGANSTREAIDLTRSAAECGANACLLVTPYYNNPTQEGLFQHYMSVAQAVDIPMILYNVPSRTACDMLPETVARLAKDAGNIIGIKEATGDPIRAESIMALCHDEFLVYSGDDFTAKELMQLGAVGVISVTANIAPKTMATVCKHALSRKHEQAHKEEQQLGNLHHDLFVEPNPIPIKWLMHKAGLIPNGIRLPLTQLSEPYKTKLNAVLEWSVIKAELSSHTRVQ